MLFLFVFGICIIVFFVYFIEIFDEFYDCMECDEKVFFDLF